MNKKIRIMVVDDHFVVRIGLTESINLETDMSVEIEASNGQQAIARFRDARPDIVLMDVKLPDMTGIDATHAICQEFPDASVIMLSTHDSEEDIYRSMQAGAKTYVLKAAAREELIETIRAVHGGDYRIASVIGARLAERARRTELTARELEVLRLVADGKSNKEIGGVLDLAEITVKIHVGRILAKLKVNDRTQAATTAIRRGVIRME
ncbi:MAG TPA: response regulator transcription factor [Verrucomicrobiae bacterium]|jgi:two-component system NarL family response regulator|nr:response regulator transcription factor [Verrucomicrobiae bacterium]